VRRGLLLLAGIVVVICAGIATINRVVDPADEFYSGAPLTAALDSNCLLADDVVGARSYPEFKQDLFGRQHPTTVVLGSNIAARPRERPFVHMGFPGFGPGPLLGALRFLATAAPKGNGLTLYVATDASWFNANVRLDAFHDSFDSKLGYLLSPWTLKSSLDVMRHSRTLAFKGWQRERVGGSCVVDRGSPYPSWRANGTFVGAPPEPRGSSAGSGFAWSRLSSLDAALGIAQAQEWRVIGFSGPRERSPQWDTYVRELSALFEKHGYPWRIRRMQP
jgi:hypothetical protein